MKISIKENVVVLDDEKGKKETLAECENVKKAIKFARDYKTEKNLMDVDIEADVYGRGELRKV